MSTKIINSTKLRKNIASVLDAISEDNSICIISRNGQQKHAIIDLDYLEDLLAISNPRYLQEIAEARQQAKAGQVFALEDVFGDV